MSHHTGLDALASQKENRLVVCVAGKAKMKKQKRRKFSNSRMSQALPSFSPCAMNTMNRPCVTKSNSIGDPQLFFKL